MIRTKLVETILDAVDEGVEFFVLSLLVVALAPFCVPLAMLGFVVRGVKAVWWRLRA